MKCIGWGSTRSWREKARQPTRLRISNASTSSRDISRKVTSPGRSAHIRSTSAPPFGGAVFFAVISATDAFAFDMSDLRQGVCLGATTSDDRRAGTLGVEDEKRVRRLPGHLVRNGTEHEPTHSPTTARGEGDEISPRPR